MIVGTSSRTLHLDHMAMERSAAAEEARTIGMRLVASGSCS